MASKKFNAEYGVSVGNASAIANVIDSDGNVYANYLNVSNAANITGNTTVGNLSVGSGNGGSLIGANLVSANFFTGTLTTAAQPNITSVGTLTSLAVTGNANVGNLGTSRVIATGNISGTQLISNIATGTAPFVVTSTTQVANLNAATSGTAGTVTTAAQPNITSVGTLSSLTVSGNAFLSTTTGNVGIGRTDATFKLDILNNTTANLAQFLYADGNGLNPRLRILGSTEGITIQETYSSNASNLMFDIAGTERMRLSGANLGIGNTAPTHTLSVTGTMNVSGNANVGNLGTAQVLATANITAPQLISNVATGTAPFVVTSTTQVANLSVATAGTATSATTAGTVTTNAQPNITSVGTLTSLAVTGNASAGNFVGTFANGNSTVAIPAANGNINLNAGGSATPELIVTTTGVNVTGTLNATGNANVGNLGTAGLITATGNITGGNLSTGGSLSVTGTGNIGGNLTAANLTVGTGSGGNITGANLVSANFFTGTLTTSAQPNITSIGTLTDLNVNGNAVVGGNLYVNGNLTYMNTETLAIEDPIINLQTGANGAAPVANSGKDVGTALNYFDTQARIAFMGWDVSNAEFGLASQASITNEVVTFSAYGNLRVGNIIGNGQSLTGLAGGNVTGQVANALVAGTVYTSAQPNITSVGTLTSLTVSGNVTPNTVVAGLGAVSTPSYTFSGDTNTGIYSPSSDTMVFVTGATERMRIRNNGFVGINVDAAALFHVRGNASDTIQTVARFDANNVANDDTHGLFIAVDAITNIVEFSSTGSNSGLFVFKNGSTENMRLSEGGNLGIGNSAPTDRLSVTGNAVISGNVSASRLISNIATGTAPLTVTSTTQVANLNAATAGTVTTAAQPNITSVGTLTGLAVTGAANLATTSGNVGIGTTSPAYKLDVWHNATANLAQFYYNDGNNPRLQILGSSEGITIQETYSTSAANLMFAIAGTERMRLSGANLGIGNTAPTHTLSVTGTTNISGNTTVGNLSVGTGNGGSLIGANLVSANFFTGTLTTAAQPNITSVGTLSSLTITGNLTVDTSTLLVDSVNNRVGIGATPTATLDVVVGSPANNNGIQFRTSNSTVGLGRFGSNPAVYWGSGSNLAFMLSSTETMRIDSSGNVGIGNNAPAHTLSVTGTTNISGNANVGNLGTAQILATANVTAPQLISNIATGTAPFVVTSTTQVANLNVSTAGTAGTVTTAAQPNITSVGTLSSLSVTGNVAAGNLTTTGVLNVTGTGVSSILGGLDMNGNTVINLSSPINASDAATKQYVDDVAQGLHTHDTCNAATNTTLASISGGTITYNNGSSGVGATLTTTGSYTTIDGVTLSNGMRILVKNEANTAHNGIYSRTSSTVLTRATDFDTPTEMAGGDFTFVTAGTLYDNTGWVMTETVTTVGTSPVLWTQFSGAGTYTAGTGLTLTGSQFSITNTTVSAASYGNGDRVATFTVNGQGQLTAASNTVITANAANLTGTTLNSSIVTSSLTSVGTLGTLSVTGNANVGNIGATTGIFTTGNITTINSGLMQNGNSNVTITANGNVTINAVGGARITATSTGANVTGTLGVSGNANVGNLGTTGLVVTGTSNLNAVGNITITGGTNGQVLTTDGAGGLSWTTVSGGGGGASISNGTSNVTIATSGGNITMGVGGTANVVTVTSSNVVLGSGTNGNISGANVISANTVQAFLAPSAGTTALAPIDFTAGSLLSSPLAGSMEYDGTAIYGTDNTTSGRGVYQPVQMYRYASAGSALGPAIADYFPANSSLNLQASSIYEVEAYLYFLKTTAGTATFTWAFSSGVNMARSYYVGTVATGFTTTTVTGTPVTGMAVAQGGAVTSLAHAATGSLTSAVYHAYHFKLMVYTNAATNLRIRITQSAGTATPQPGSYYYVKKLPVNAGVFAA